MADIILDRQREFYLANVSHYTWHSFTASNSEETNYFFSHVRLLFCSVFPPRTNICIEYSSTSVTRCMTFADCRPQTTDCRLQTADRRLQTADCRLQTTDCRPQIAGCKLKDTKNLPNKGDTIKNVTSCESEKVAWEQG